MPYLTPSISKTVEDFLADQESLFRLVTGFGSPLNLIFPEQVTHNLDQLEKVFKDHKIRGRVFYASKTNKSEAILRQLSSTNGAAIDVASSAELKAALGAGFSANRIEATGPKNDEFLRLCILHEVIINLDDRKEYDRILRIHSQLGHVGKVRILLRIARPNVSNQTKRAVRFGMEPQDIDAVLERCASNDTIELLGFSFHLATTGLMEKTAMLETACEYIMKASDLGLPVSVIDIGGGLAINYVESRNEWEKYIGSLKRSLLEPKLDTMTWQNSGLGFWAENGKIRGAANFSDFYVTHTPAEQLTAFLNLSLKNLGMTFGQFVNESGITLCIEPGRALVEQAGITIGKVLYTKQTETGEMLVVCDMNRSNLNAQDMEYMVDPIIISKERRKEGDGFLSGNLCLPHDFLTRRKVYFRQMPDEGDLIVFPNTAGYLMDFSESHTLRQPIAKKLALKQVSTTFNYYEDDKYPVLQESTL